MGSPVPPPSSGELGYRVVVGVPGTPPVLLGPDGTPIRMTSFVETCPGQAPGTTLSACYAVGTGGVDTTLPRGPERSGPFDAARSEPPHRTGIPDSDGATSISPSQLPARLTPPRIPGVAERRTVLLGSPDW